MIKKRLFLLLLAFGLALTFGCGNAKEHDDDNGSGGSQIATGIRLIFESDEARQSDVLRCVAPGDDQGVLWDPGTNFNQNQQAVINNAQPGNYICNIERQNDNWVVYSLTEHLFGPTVTSQDSDTVLSTYLITEGDIVSNEMGGGNWELWLSDGGTVSGPGGGGTVDPPDCINPVPTIDVEIVIKDYSGGFAFTPFVYFTGNGWNPSPMTMVTANMYSYTFSDVPTDLLHTINFKDDPANSNYLFDQSGPTDDYIVLVNGVQVNQMLDDDIRVELDPCGNIITPLYDLTFTFTPSDVNAHDVNLIFGQNYFNSYAMDLVGSDWIYSLDNVTPGRYEANIMYMSFSPDVAVWPGDIKGTITINGQQASATDIIIYAQDVALPDPTGDWLVYVRANLVFDLMPNGNIVGVDLRNSDIIVIIPVP